MKSSELRIGNYVYGDDNVIVKIARTESEQYTEWNSGNDFSIISQDMLSENDYYEDKVKPVELTEKLLIKFGFSKREGNNICWDLDNFMIGWYGNALATWLIGYEQNKNSLRFHSQIKYVHELQNLYFVLTGSELVFSTEP